MHKDIIEGKVFLYEMLIIFETSTANVVSDNLITNGGNTIGKIKLVNKICIGQLEFFK